MLFVQDFLEGKTPFVVESENFDLVKPNEHLYHSEVSFTLICFNLSFPIVFTMFDYFNLQVMRAIIGQIVALWNMSLSESTPLQRQVTC